MSGIVKRISSLFRLGNARYLAGTDLSSNKYYEYPSIDGDPDPRRTRRLVRYRVHKELGEFDQSTLPTQWLMWLRHTRRSAPTVEELVQDQERIANTQHNAWVLEQKDLERRMQLEAKAEEEVRERQLIEQETYGSSKVPTSTVLDREAVAEAKERVPFEGVGSDGKTTVQQRRKDMEVWEASRRRVEEQERRAQEQAQINPPEQEQQQHINLQDSPAGRSQASSETIERERARAMMNQSPLSAFDVSFEDEGRAAKQRAPPQQPRIQQRGGLNPTFGRHVGPGEDWSPQEWQPGPARRR